jgi:hypothetical protein
MAVIAVNTFTSAPGKQTEAQTLLKEVVEIASGFGAKGQVNALVRGGVQGTLSVVLEYPDTVSYGAALDRTNADPSWQKFLARAQQAQALVPVRSLDYVELPGLEVPHADIASRSVVVATLFKIRDGKQTQSLERIARSKAITEKHGGKVRSLQSIASDPFGLTASVVYYENFTAWGKAGAALAADPEWQAFGAEIRGAQASSDFLRTMLMRVI